jgi:hypothetical protein
MEWETTKGLMKSNRYYKYYSILLKARTVEPAEQSLLDNGCETHNNELQIHTHQREHPKKQSNAIFQQKKGKSEIWSWAPKGCPTPRHTD